MSSLEKFETYEMSRHLMNRIFDEDSIGMKMFKTYDMTIKYVINTYPHREKEVYESIRDGKDSIYNCDVYKEWCYKKLLELNLHKTHNFFKKLFYYDE